MSRPISTPVASTLAAGGGWRRARGAILAGAMLLSGAGAALPANAAAPERAREAAARGDLRAAQLEWRNAVRDDPGSAAARVSLALTSLELGDGEVAEREARAALDRGYDPVRGTALLMRTYLATGRFDELLRDFPAPGPAPANPAVAGQVAAGRAFALLGTNQAEPAREATEAALRLAPEAEEVQLAAAALAMATGDRAGAEAAVDRVLARDPASLEGLLRKGSLQFERRELRPALESFSGALAAAPSNVVARLRRAEVLLQLNDLARTKEDLDAVLAVMPNSPPGLYLRAVLLARTQDWAGVDTALQPIGAVLGNFPDGFLLLAFAKRGLGQTAQAEDAARRHLARHPEDPRGARFVAGIEIDANRPEEAMAILSRLAERGGADAESMDLLGRLYSRAGRTQEAVTALTRAAELAPGDAGVLGRLAAARMAAGDTAGTAAAAEGALQRDPNRPGVREMLAFTALQRGDLPGVEAELARLDPAARRSEVAGVLQGTLHLARFELQPAKAAFATVLRDYPGSAAARIGLARVARIENRPEEVERLLGEVLRADPANVEAIGQLAAAALPGSPRAEQARAVLAAAQEAAPGVQTLALTRANMMMRAGDAAGAARLLAAAPLQGQVQGQGSVTLLLARAEAHAAAGEWAEAEAQSRLALAQDANSVPARRQLAGLLVRSGDTRGAETLIEQGLRAQPAEAALQQTLAALVLQARGLDAALATADRIAAQPGTQPASLALRGDVLTTAQKPKEAAAAYGEALVRAPSGLLALRQAAALRASGDVAGAATALRTWLAAHPDDDGAQLLLSQFEIDAGRNADAEKRLEGVVARRPEDPVSLNNLAWLLGQRNGDAAAQSRALALAGRAYFLTPNPDTADTLGWIMARGGQAERAVPLLRQSAMARTGDRPDPASAYRLAYALRATGGREEALAVLAPAMEGAPAFPDKAEADRLLADLRARR
ncbi:XrtA/PEP-CTERM system TPR-repeat protein PrsT [Roseomonas indoligenes]|uniref:PEP-CTERM system TPR-repeat protein PrsT n=1 Tax=Roseomonas indoligenes TaxID=2820811 RepID=A0A940N6N0_9PROT|nr:XrtA/PEP-CTERM system TPR-repeat protein PrsT [Pararoseomonas indoligenes]MBP0496100.1 PEP-CTERM system TPR-repeat protein PrsT [Pararoseomonas indoligenes]